MQSITAAMTWDLVSRGRWALSAIALTMLAFPMLIMWSIGSISSLYPDDLSTHLLNFLFMQANLMTGGGVLMILNMQQLRRIYPYPAATATLVNGQLLPAGALLALDMAAWTAMLNTLFRLHWPLWEPMFFAVAALAMAHAAMWVCYGSLWMLCSLTVVSGLFAFWMKWHYGPLFGELEHAWSPMTPIEAIMLLTLTVVAHRVAVWGLARARRGEPPLSIGLVAWINGLADRRNSHHAPFASAAAAQTWYFQQRGWVAPFAVAVVSALALVIWSFVSRDVMELVAAFAHGSWLVTIAAVLGGVVLGAVGSRDDVVMGQFLATRPITTVDLSRRLLGVAAKNLAIAWAVWGAIFLAILLASRVAGDAPWEYLPPNFGWRWFAGSMLLSWAAMSTIIAIALIGRARLIGRAVVGLSFGYVALMLSAKFALTSQAFELLMHGLVILLGVGCTAGTIAAMVVALRRRLIEAPIAGAAIAVWIALLVAGMLAWPTEVELGFTGQILLYGSLALIVAPIATAPLALAWNRTR
jgi:hypothetical protein